MNHDDIIHVQLEAPTLADLRSFVDEVQPDIGCRAFPRRINGQFVMDAYLPESQLQSVQANRGDSRVAIQVVENATEVGRERQGEVSEGNRFAARGEIPRGLGLKE